MAKIKKVSVSIRKLSYPKQTTKSKKISVSRVGGVKFGVSKMKMSKIASLKMPSVKMKKMKDVSLKLKFK